MATQVIWRGNDEDGFYTSHLVTGSGRHTQFGHYGEPTGRTFVSRTIADCMVYENKIYREWVVADTMAIIKQLGLDPHAFAERFAREHFEKGFAQPRHRREPPAARPVSARDARRTSRSRIIRLEEETLRWLHEVYNKRMFGKIKEVYAPTAQWHGPLMKELYGQAAVLHQTLALVGSIPDCAYAPQHICSVPCEEGGDKVAVRWIMEGHHIGYGLLGEPTGQRLQVMGMSHFHYKDGQIVDDWTRLRRTVAADADQARPDGGAGEGAGGSAVLNGRDETNPL